MTATLLDALEAALRAERDALSGQDVEALLLSTEAKLQALLQRLGPSKAQQVVRLEHSGHLMGWAVQITLA